MSSGGRIGGSGATVDAVVLMVDIDGRSVRRDIDRNGAAIEPTDLRGFIHCEDSTSCSSGIVWLEDLGRWL